MTATLASSYDESRRRRRRRAGRGGRPVRRRRPAGPAARLGRLRGRAGGRARSWSCARPDALRRLLWHPGELGAAQAYVTGELEVPRRPGATRSPTPSRSAASAGCRDARAAVALARGAAHRRSASACSGGRRRRRRRRRGYAAGCTAGSATGSAISHHYDLSNEFYALILDPPMAYSCAYYGDDPDQSRRVAPSATSSTWSAASSASGPGMRLLDVGCGWGSLSLHAAEHFGAQVIGVTIAAEQKRVHRPAHRASAASSDRVEIRLQDYRDVPANEDAVRRGRLAGDGRARRRAQLPDVRRRSCGARSGPGGRVLVQQMSRDRAGTRAAARSSSRSSRPTCTCGRSARPSAYLERGGLEVRDVHALREHYVRTVAGWLENVRGAPARADRAGRRGGRPGLAALPRRRLAGLPRRPDGRRPDPVRAAGRRAHACRRSGPGDHHLVGPGAARARRRRGRDAADGVRRPSGRPGLRRRRHLGARAGGDRRRRGGRRAPARPGAAGWWPCSWSSWGVPARAGTSSRRAKGGGEDPRYAEMLGDGGSRTRDPQGLRRPGAGDLPGLAAGAWRPRTPTSRSGRWSWVGCRRLGRRRGLRGRRRRPARGVQARPRPRARSWTAVSGAGPGTPTTSATPACGGASGSPAARPRAGWPALVTVLSLRSR